MATPPTLQPDQFWDGKMGGGVRASSTGQAASQYQDPSTAYFEGNGGRSIAQCLPTGAGARGVIVPRATWWGGSRGFDPHKPRLMNVDPDIKGQSSVVDYSKLDKEIVAAAYQAAWEQVGEYGDPRLIAAQAYRNLAVSTEPVGMSGSQMRSLPDPNQGQPPIPGMDVYVAPKAARGGGQEMPLMPLSAQQQVPQEALVSPSVASGPPSPPSGDPRSVMAGPFATPEDMEKATPRQFKQAAVQASQANYDPWGNQPQGQSLVQARPPAQMLPPAYVPQQQPTPPQPQPAYEPPQQMQRPPMSAPLPTMFPQAQQGFNPFAAQIQAPVPAQASLTPQYNVVFEIQGWGRVDAAFHGIVRQGALFVFVWDKRCPTGKIFPPKMEPREDNSAAIALVIRETPDRIFYIHSTGQTFEHGTYEYCVCVLDKEVPVAG